MGQIGSRKSLATLLVSSKLLEMYFMPVLYIRHKKRAGTRVPALMSKVSKMPFDILVLPTTATATGEIKPINLPRLLTSTLVDTHVELHSGRTKILSVLGITLGGQRHSPITAPERG